MRDQLSRAAYQKPIFAEAPVLLIGVGGRRSEPEIGVGHDGTHAVDRDIGAGHAEQSAALIVTGLEILIRGLGLPAARNGSPGEASPVVLGPVYHSCVGV